MPVIPITINPIQLICYKDRTYCSSEVETHTCGRELTQEDKRKAEESGLPVAWGDFCNPVTND